MTPRQAIRAAVAYFGSEEKLAEATGFSLYHVQRSVRTGQAKAELAHNIEVVTNGEITRLMLRPDLFARRATKLIRLAWSSKIMRSSMAA